MSPFGESLKFSSSLSSNIICETNYNLLSDVKTVFKLVINFVKSVDLVQIHGQTSKFKQVQGYNSGGFLIYSWSMYTHKSVFLHMKL